MKYGLIGFLVMVIVILPRVLGAVTAEDFQVRTTQGLIDLCSVSANDPLAKESIHFCHGYLVGALHYYFALCSGPEGERLVCLPNPPPDRNTTIATFVEWAKAHPQYMNEAPVETEFRFLVEKWPCKP